MVFLSLLLFLTSCIENIDHQTSTSRGIFPLEAFSNYINNKNFSSEENINLDEDKSILNLEYPIQIWLYANNKYFYDLPNLGKGSGNWLFKDGYLELENFHQIKTIDLNIRMNYELFFNENKKALVLKFSDRFGINSIQMERIAP